MAPCETGCDAMWIERRLVDLVLFRAWADLKSETERTYLGFVWWVLEPMLFLGVFYVVIGFLQGRRGVEFVSFLLVGVVLWQWFKAAVSHAGDSVYHNLHLVRNVRVATWVFPATTVVADTVKFLLLLTILLVLLPTFGLAPSLLWLHLFPVLLAELLLILGVGMLLAALIPFIPDLRFAVEAGLHALMFISGVFFSLDNLAPELRRTMLLNPIANLIEQARRVLLQGLPPDYPALALLGVMSVTLFVAGLLALSYGRRRFAKLAI